jgi:hypothetical protein
MRDSYTNPSKTKRIEYFGIFDLTKRIHETNLWKTGLRNESTIRIFGKPAYKTNPRYESLRFGFASPPAWICKDSFRAIVLRIREDSLDSWKQVESLKNQSTKRIHETNLLKTLRIRDPRYETNPDLSITKRIFLESGFVTTIRNESMDSRNESTFLQISYTIPASLEILLSVKLQYEHNLCKKIRNVGL